MKKTDSNFNSNTYKKNSTFLYLTEMNVTGLLRVDLERVKTTGPSAFLDCCVQDDEGFIITLGLVNSVVTTYFSFIKCTTILLVVNT